MDSGMASTTRRCYGSAMHPSCPLVKSIPLGLALTCFYQLTAAENHEIIWIDRIPVVPSGNLIFDDGRVELHPKLLLGLGYDSNLDATPKNPDGDVYARGLAGLQMYWLPGVADRIVLDGQFETRRYQDRHDHDFTGGRVQVGWTRESAIGPLAAVMLGGMLVDDPLIETGVQVLRSRYDVDAGWWMRGTLNTIRFGVSAVAENFLEDAVVFDAYERDYTRPRLSAEWRYGRSDGQTILGLRVEFDRINYQQSGSDYQDGSGVDLSALVDHHFAPLLSLFGSAGIEHRRYSDNFSRNAVYGDATMVRPTGQLLLRWDPEEYTRVDIGVASQVTPTIDANAAYLLQGWLHARWRLRRSLGIFGEVDYYDLQRSGSAISDNPHTLTLRLRTGTEIWARDGFVIRLTVGSDRGNLGNSAAYERYLTTVDTAFTW